MKPQMQIAQGWYLVACYSVEGRVSYTDRTVPYPSPQFISKIRYLALFCFAGPLSRLTAPPLKQKESALEQGVACFVRYRDRPASPGQNYDPLLASMIKGVLFSLLSNSVVLCEYPFHLLHRNNWNLDDVVDLSTWLCLDAITPTVGAFLGCWKRSKILESYIVPCLFSLTVSCLTSTRIV
ncbi:RBR-type E3 ubiquitin transferase [Fusarium oxysporum f. sp. albedinis]|nr:RBR-type E3 ubiquitin transferase [Fusarium oxysporum f. sp. albedinis]